MLSNKIFRKLPAFFTKKMLLFVLLHLLLLLYSLCGFFSKSASTVSPTSIQFWFYYGGVIAILGIYAIGWQQIIKRLPLTVAFANKAVTTAWGLLWGFLFFGEQITVGKLLGVALVIGGVVLFSIADQEA